MGLTKLADTDSLTPSQATYLSSQIYFHRATLSKLIQTIVPFTKGYDKQSIHSPRVWATEAKRLWAKTPREECSEQSFLRQDSIVGVGSGSNPLIETPPESRLGLSLRTPASSRLASSLSPPPPLFHREKEREGGGVGAKLQAQISDVPKLHATQKPSDSSW